MRAREGLVLLPHEVPEPHPVHIVTIYRINGRGQVYSSARAAITKSHSLGAETAEMRCPAVLEDGSLRPGCGQNWFLLRVEREGSVPGLSPWLVDAVFMFT